MSYKEKLLRLISGVCCKAENAEIVKLGAQLENKDDEILGYKNKIQALEISNRGLAIELKDIVSASSSFTFKVAPIKYETPVKVSNVFISSALENAKSLAVLDTYSYGIKKEDVQRILDLNQAISNSVYIKSEYDCDDFAIATYGLFNQPTLGRFAFGLAMSRTHAFNIFVDTDKKVWVVEPQTRVITSLEEAEATSSIYKINRYLI